MEPADTINKMYYLFAFFFKCVTMTVAFSVHTLVYGIILQYIKKYDFIFCYIIPKWVKFDRDNLKRKTATDRSGHGRWDGAVGHVGVVDVTHHDVTGVGWVEVTFVVHVLMLSWLKKIF